MKKRKASTENSGKNSGKRHHGKPENLKPWRKGKSGNPAGRPKLKPISDALREILEETDPKKRETRAKVIARRLVMKAQNGDLAAASFVTERTEGKAVQPISGPNEEPISISTNINEELAAVVARLRARAAERAAAGGKVPE